MVSMSAIWYFPNYHLHRPARPRRIFSEIPSMFSSHKTFPPYVQVNRLAEDDVLQDFLKEREMSGDFISRLSDGLWLNKGLNVTLLTRGEPGNKPTDSGDGFPLVSEEPVDEEDEGGFLKLKQNSEWLMGARSSAPLNKRTANKDARDDGVRRKMLNFLRYEALKRELLLLTVGIGCACTGYCLVVFSLQAAVSYAIGVFFSCVYFQLLCRHVDKISRETVPLIFTKKKSKKIGIRSQDFQDLFERFVKGVSIALSSPRLVIPAAIYALWELSQHFALDVFEFQLVPAMVGVFAYKAAALVQVYRDNEDLQFIFPDDADEPRD